MRKVVVVLLLAVTGVAHAAVHAHGLAGHAWLTMGAPCPTLLTVAECNALRASYAALTSNAARAAWLREHDAFMRDREQACLCLHQDLLLAEQYPATR